MRWGGVGRACGGCGGGIRANGRSYCCILCDRSCYFICMVETQPRIDGRRVRGDATRRAIVRRAMQVAGTEGLEGISLARLAGDLGMSKSGLFAHFDSKEDLQLATLRGARRFFTRHAIEPAQAEPEGLPRLRALVDAWLKYLGEEADAGGCLFIEGAAEYNGRTGPVRDMIADTMSG